jgi:hypothetical protein
MFLGFALTADSFASGRNNATPTQSEDVAFKELEKSYLDHQNKIDENMSNVYLESAVRGSSEKRVDLILNPPKTKTLISKPRENKTPSTQSVRELIISSAPINCPKKIIEKLLGYLKTRYAHDAEVLNSVLKRSVVLGDSDLFKQVLEHEKANTSGTESDRAGVRRIAVTQKGIDAAFFTACLSFRVDSLGPDFINIFLTGSHGFKASPEAVFAAIVEELKLPKSHILEKLLLPEQFENTYVKLSKSPETLESFKKFVVFIQSKQRLLSDNAKKDAFLGALRANMGALELIINNPLLSPSQEILDEVFLIAAVLPNEKVGFLTLLNSSKINVSGLVDALVDLSNTLLHSKDKVVPDHAIKSSIRESCKEILKKLISMSELEKEDMDSMLLACIYMNEAADFNSVLNHQKYKIDQDTINLALAEAVRAKSIELLSIILNNEKLKPNQDAAGTALKILTRMYEKNPISPEELAILDQMLEKIMNAQVKPKQDDQNKAFLRLCSLEGRDKPLLLFLKAFENEKYQIDGV